MNKLQYGMPTLIELSSLEETASLCCELGLDFIELNMNLPQYQADKLDVRKLSRIAKQYNIYYTIHLEEGFNPCDFNKRVAKAYIDTALQMIQLSKQTKIPLLNMHLVPGIKFTLPDKRIYLFDEYKDIWLHNLREFRNTVTVAVNHDDIKICVENTGGGFDPDAFTHEGVMLLLESPVFGITYDIGHNAKRDLAQEAAFIEGSNRLLHMHCHDVINGRDHLPLGAGELDILYYLDLAHKHECRVLLETKTIAGLKQSVTWLCQKHLI
jgi:sugar phosphate isomerase/epimerase